MGKFSDVMKSGVLGLGTAALARNPKMLRGFGVLGNVGGSHGNLEVAFLEIKFG